MTREWYQKLVTALCILVAVITAMFWSDGREGSEASEEAASSNGDAVVIVAEAEIIFSHTDYFYEESIQLSFVKMKEDIQALFYTMEGQPPDGEAGILYTGEIALLTGLDSINSYTVKVCGQNEDGSFTDVYTHTYFVGAGVFERFDTLVFSLSTDPYNLYDYDYGIAVPGRLRDEYMAENPWDTEPYPSAPANYNMRGREAERPVHVEIIDQNGELILAQNAGVRVNGGWSREMEQKSLQLYARNEYEAGKNTFAYDFFPDDRTYYGRPISEYSRLTLRNSSTDNHNAFARSEIVMDCAAAAMQDTQSRRAAAVFLNGEYYGFAWVCQVIDDDYLDDHNEIKNGEWVNLKGGECYVDADEEDPMETQAKSDFMAMYEMHGEDLTDDRVFAALCELVDMENLLTYYAIQLYISNIDWGHKNYDVYRYYGEAGSGGADGVATTDGRWRFVLHDVDQTLGPFRMPADYQTLAWILGFAETEYGISPSPLLIAILEREDMKARFVTIMCDLMNYHFSPQNIEEAARRKEAERYNELAWNYKLGGAELKEAWSSMEKANEEIEAIIYFGQERPYSMMEQLQEYLGISGAGYVVTCSPHELADIKISTCLVTDDFEGLYFDISTLEVSASKADGWEFSHWLVNGAPVAEERLTIGRDEAVDGIIHLELALERMYAGGGRRLSV
ncbi:MAG: CotH kinase family protein [Lachnospiraceae bacterium]|jgi:hypothetical protein|nr:CotH kinase family protein [Lachnospiraceae bacterium]